MHDINNLTQSDTLFYNVSNNRYNNKHVDEYDHHHIGQNGSTSHIMISGTYESNYAIPGWIVLPNYIINTSRIEVIQKIDNYISIKISDRWIQIDVKDINTTWPYLQNLFTKGTKANE